MDLAAARGVLGVAPGAAWPEVRAAYLRLVREHHPDAAADTADSGMRTVRTAQVTQAYAALLAARPRPVTARASEAPVVTRLGGDSRQVLLDAGLSDGFTALLDVFHVVGVVSYVDRSSGVLETIVTPAPGEATSLLAMLEPAGRERTEAILSVESLGGHAPAELDPLVDDIARLLATPRMWRA